MDNDISVIGQEKEVSWISVKNLFICVLLQDSYNQFDIEDILSFWSLVYMNVGVSIVYLLVLDGLDLGHKLCDIFDEDCLRQVMWYWQGLFE